MACFEQMLALACDGGEILSCVNEVHATACFKLAKVKLHLCDQPSQKMIQECCLLLKDFLVLQACFKVKTQ